MLLVLRNALIVLPFFLVVVMLTWRGEAPQDPFNEFAEDPFSMQEGAFEAQFPRDSNWFVINRSSADAVVLAGDPVSCSDLPEPLRCLGGAGEGLWLHTGAGVLMLTDNPVELSRRALKSSLPDIRPRLLDACDWRLASRRWHALRETWLSRPWQLLGELGLSGPGPRLPGYAIEVAPAQWLEDLQLQLGDRVMAIDGLPLDAMHIPKLVDRLVDAEQFSLTLWRSGETQARRYCIASADAA